MTQTIFTLFMGTMKLMDRLVLLTISLALLGFLWGLLKFLFSRDNEKLRNEGKDFMIYGILTLFVMSCLWGLVNLFVKFIGDGEYIGDINKSGSGDILVPDDAGNRIENYQDIFENNNPKDMV